MKPNIITVLTLLLAVLFGSCNDQSDSPIYGRWRLEKYNSIATSSYGLTQVEKNENYVLQLDNTGVFCCTTDCNNISGNFGTDKTTLAFSNISLTEKAIEGIISCDDMLLERSIEANLRCIKSYELKDTSTMYLMDADDHILIVLTK